MLKRSRLSVGVLLVLLCGGVSGQTTGEDHKPTILGIELGMTPQAVVERLGGREAQSRKEEKDAVQKLWRVEGGNVLQVTFRKDRVAHIALQYRSPRPTTDLWLVPLSSPASRSGLTASDPRLRRDYKATELLDKTRTVWSRQEKSPADYRIEIQFLSGSRQQYGERFEEYVDFKYVSVVKDDLKKFEKAVLSENKP
ncbi:MAG: hypothetical protein HY234_13145 [Acidobacteria bacterium]|nr:hypothetical protein [Acidobacteriota bacterium]MBI3663981.1 hypothetical protein [Acidobacteriota bacterium]